MSLRHDPIWTTARAPFSHMLPARDPLRSLIYQAANRAVPGG
jgi:hypothetical protein